MNMKEEKRGRGNFRIVRDRYITEKLGLEKYKIMVWIYPVLTFVIGDVVTTYYGTQTFGLYEKNPIILATGIHSDPIAFAEIKLYILTFAFIVTTLMYFLLRDLENYFYYSIPVLTGTIGLLAVVNNIIQILKVA